MGRADRRGGAPRAALLACATLAGALAAGPAGAVVGDPDGAGGLDGSVRMLVLGLDAPPGTGIGEDEPGSDGISQTVGRLVAAGRPTPSLRYQLHAVAVATLSTAITAGGGEVTGGSLLDLAPQATRYRALDATWNPVADGDVTVTTSIDRAAVRGSWGPVDLTAGRQAITLGKAYFWNPLDVFLAFDPRQFDRDYKPGVDAARLDLALGDFSGLTVVGAAGRTVAATGVSPDDDRDLDATWFGSALLGRAFTTWEGWDLAVQGGKVYGGLQLGGAASGELATVALRLEAAWLEADEERSPRLLPGSPEALVESHAAVVVGLGHRFESSLDLEAEYLYNGAGDPDDLLAAAVRFGTGGALHLGRHLTGVLASYELGPLLLGQVAWIHGWDDGSGQVQPSGVLSLADEVDLVGGAILGYGDAPGTGVGGLPRLRSEFGSFPDVLFLELKAYF